MMPVVTSRVDPDARTVTIVTELAAAPGQVWTLWSEPARFANWWGPPGYPLTVTHHELVAGGSIVFHVTVEEHTVINARLRCAAVQPYESLGLVFTTDGLEDDTDIGVVIEPIDDRTTRMTVTAGYRDDRSLRRALEIGFDRGITTSVERADAALVPTA